MVKTQSRGGKPPTAVLARIRVACEDVAAIKLDTLPRQPRKGQYSNDAGHRYLEANRANPIVFVGFELVLERTELRPVGEIVRSVPSILNAEHFRDRLVLTITLAEQRKRPTRTDHSKGHVMSVEKQDTTIQSSGLCDTTGCENSPSFPSQTSDRQQLGVTSTSESRPGCPQPRPLAADGSRTRRNRARSITKPTNLRVILAKTRPKTTFHGEFVGIVGPDTGMPRPGSCPDLFRTIIARPATLLF